MHLNIRDNHNWNCLHHAVKSGSVDCVKFLLKFKELDTFAETFEGETGNNRRFLKLYRYVENNSIYLALHIACVVPNISYEIVSLLIEANADLVNFVNNEEVDLLQCAAARGRLDIVKLLINNGAQVNYQDLDGDTALHIAALELHLEIIRYLLVETDADVTIRNLAGYTACYLLFTKLLEKLFQNLNLSQGEIDCFEEMLLLTHDLQDLSDSNKIDFEINEMILLAYRFKQHGCPLHKTISLLFCAPPSKQYFLEKILNSNVPSCHCLVYALLNIDLSTSDSMSEMWCNLLAEMFMLCATDQSFFDEFISEIMTDGWKPTVLNQIQFFCEFLEMKQNLLEPAALFHFLKTLILYDFDFGVFLRCSDLSILSPTLTVTVLAPLARVATPNRDNEAVSLMNICRTKIRSHYFNTYTHYTALRALYSLNVPVTIRNFVCYNESNFKF
ncbi:Ankyrin repeat and SOCS box protein 3 [Pseudolycoriella hygida]|uniref:Ankyrin repeat and SOCS box protein 3 n=1 Tax=Pseudolycoriella hygida TaxID=35572 RepID=A0A9Q0NH07_9DIPT|nr:Ankyrin repeat and SOCS box protein 3 [Pseudolycoriella hygida]